MLKRSPSWRVLAPIAVLALAMLAPSASQAASYRFKVNLTIQQDTGWELTVRHPRTGGGYCGSDVHWNYYSEGGGKLRANIVGARVTFKGSRRMLQSTEIRVPAKQIADAKDFTISQVGTPDEGCDLPAPPKFDVGECNPFAWRPGKARSFASTCLRMRSNWLLPG